jgi:hypothetical protein
MSFQRAFTVRAAPLRSAALSLANAIFDRIETSRLERGLLGFQLRARRGDVRPVLLRGVQSFF